MLLKTDHETLDRLRPHLERVLVVEPHAPSARLTIDLLKSMGAGNVQAVARSSQGFSIAETFHPQLIVTALVGEHVDGVLFTRRLRRSNFVCRQAPVIVVGADPTAEKIKAARDAGAHEFLKRPFSAGDLLKRVENVSLKPRRWVEAVIYVGPDRRRFNSGEYKGTRKRRSDGADTPPTPAERVQEALKVLHSALLNAHADPKQAERSIRTQLEELSAVALRAGDPRMVHAVADLDRYVTSLSRGDKPKKALGPTFVKLASAAAEASELGAKAG